MAILITRTAVVPVWFLGSVIVVVFAAPSGTVAMGLLLLTSGLAAAAILLLGKSADHPWVSHGPSTIEVRPSADRPRRGQTRDSGISDEARRAAKRD
jgi:hypothetical protein